MLCSIDWFTDRKNVHFGAHTDETQPDWKKAGHTFSAKYNFKTATWMVYNYPSSVVSVSVKLWKLGLQLSGLGRQSNLCRKGQCHSNCLSVKLCTPSHCLFAQQRLGRKLTLPSSWHTTGGIRKLFLCNTSQDNVHLQCVTFKEDLVSL